jgi:hypothetical protein
MLLLPYVFLKPDFSGLYYLAALQCAVCVVVVLAVVVTGIVLARTGRRRAVILAAVLACLTVALWRGPFGPLWFSHDFIAISSVAVPVTTTALVACLLYPVVRSALVLFSDAPPRVRIPAGLLVVAALVFGLRAGLLPFHYGLAQLTKNPDAFRAAFADYQRDEAVLPYLRYLLILPDIGDAIAQNPATPSDVLVTISRSGESWRKVAALRNPSFPAAHFLDADILHSQSGRLTIMGDERLIRLLPIDTLDALVRQYPDVRLRLVARFDLLRTMPRSTLQILSADTSEYVRELAKRASAMRDTATVR